MGSIIFMKSGAVLLFVLPNACTPVELWFLQDHGWKLRTVHSLSIVDYMCLILECRVLVMIWTFSSLIGGILNLCCVIIFVSNLNALPCIAMARSSWLLMEMDLMLFGPWQIFRSQNLLQLLHMVRNFSRKNLWIYSYLWNILFWIIMLCFAVLMMFINCSH